MITDEQYEEFVRKLIKPSEQLDAEITEDEQLLLELAESVGAGARMSANYVDCDRPNYLNLLHMRVGLSSEGGELADAIKKIVIYRKDVGDINVKGSIAWNVREEVGDLCWFQTGNKIIRNLLGSDAYVENFYDQLKSFLIQWNLMYPTNTITLDSAKQFNMEKLGERYRGLKFTNEAAQNRADKGE